MTEHVCEFKPMLVECECGRSLTISEICKSANATERLSAEKARASANVIVSLTSNLPDATVYDYLVISNILYADILEDKK